MFFGNCNQLQNVIKNALDKAAYLVINMTQPASAQKLNIKRHLLCIFSAYDGNIYSRDGSIPLFQNRYDIDIFELKISAIPIYRRYFLFLVDIFPIFTFRRLSKD